MPTHLVVVPSPVLDSSASVAEADESVVFQTSAGRNKITFEYFQAVLIVRPARISGIYEARISGTRNTHGHITKRRSAELRAMLCEAAQHARRKNHPLYPFFMSVCVKRGYKVAMVSVAHRLARILFAMLRDGTRFDERIAGIEHGPFTYERTVEYRRATG